MSRSWFSASSRINWEQTRLAVFWSIAEPMKTMRSFNSRWKMSEPGPTSAPRLHLGWRARPSRDAGTERGRRAGVVHERMSLVARGPPADARRGAPASARGRGRTAATPRTASTRQVSSTGPRCRPVEPSGRRRLGRQAGSGAPGSASSPDTAAATRHGGSCREQDARARPGSRAPPRRRRPRPGARGHRLDAAVRRTPRASDSITSTSAACVVGRQLVVGCSPETNSTAPARPSAAAYRCRARPRKGSVRGRPHDRQLGHRDGDRRGPRTGRRWCPDGPCWGPAFPPTATGVRSRGGGPEAGPPRRHRLERLGRPRPPPA